MMRRIDGDRLGRWSLRLDAMYCVALGSAVAVGAERIAHGVALPPLAIALAGIAVLTVAVDIALFAASQAVALRTLPARG